MNKDQTPDPGTGIPEDAESDDDDTLDLTEAMAVTPPTGFAPASPPDSEEEETVDLANVTTMIGDGRGEDIGASDESAAPEADDDEVVDLAAAAEPPNLPPSLPDEEDDEFGSPRATVAISSEEMAGLGLSRAPESAPAAEQENFSGDDTLREQPTELNTDFGAGEIDPETAVVPDAPGPAEAAGDDPEGGFLDIGAETLVAMGREFEAKNGAAADATLAPGDMSDDDPDDDDVIDLGALASPARSPAEAETDRDAETVIAPPPDADEPISTGEPIDLSPADFADEESVDRNASTVFMPAGIGDETGTPDADSDSEAEDFETFLLAPEPDEEDETPVREDASPEEFSADRESLGDGGIPAGGFSDLDRPTPEIDDGDAVDSDAETLFMSMSDWDDEDEDEDDDEDDGGLSALELLDSISGLPDPGAETGSEHGFDGGDIRPPDDDAPFSDPMEELYGLMETSRVAAPDLGPDLGSDREKTGAAKAEETRKSDTKAGTAETKPPGTDEVAPDSDPSQKAADGNAVALPEARSEARPRGGSGEERCFSITPDQMQTILERVVDKIFSQKIEKILTDVIERAVADEMRKLESYFFEELDDRGDQ
jgi:hypothetical protein